MRKIIIGTRPTEKDGNSTGDRHLIFISYSLRKIAKVLIPGTQQKKPAETAHKNVPFSLPSFEQVPFHINKNIHDEQDTRARVMST